MIIAFIGHSFVPSGAKVKERVKEEIRKNILKESHIMCYLGGYGGFDEICACACRELKKECGRIEIIYITPYFSLSDQEKIKEMERYGLYDASIYPPIENVPKRFAILKRNEWIMSNADLVIAYVDRDYGGAYKALCGAKRKKKKIINLCDVI